MKSNHFRPVESRNDEQLRIHRHADLFLAAQMNTFPFMSLWNLVKWGGQMIPLIALSTLLVAGWAMKFFLVPASRGKPGPFLMALWLPFVFGMLGFIYAALKVARSMEGLGSNDRSGDPSQFAAAIGEMLISGWFGASATAFLLVLGIIITLLPLRAGRHIKREA